MVNLDTLNCLLWTYHNRENEKITFDRNVGLFPFLTSATQQLVFTVNTLH
jgi:hypothetical protein